MKEGWKIKTLGDIGKISMCKRVFKNQTLPSGEIPFYKIGTFGKTPDAFITQELYDDFRGKYSFPKKGDILISASGTIGRRVVYDGEPAYFQDSNIVWIDNDEKQVSNDYLYQFYGFCDWNPSKGATISRLYNDDLRKIKIPIPPLSEQKRIVSILDAAFAAIDRAKANVEKNLRNARELFESYLEGVFGIAKTKWPRYQLSNYLDLITYGFTNPMPTTSSGPYMVTAKNVKGGIVDYETSRRTSQEAFDELITDKSRPQKGDVLLTKDGTLGRLAVVERANLCINQSVALLRPNSKMDPYYLKLLLSSPFYQRLMIEQAGGATIKHIYITRVDKMDVPVPSIKEQHSIVQKLETLSSQTQTLETHYRQKLTALEELKKSILQKAFAGELT